MHAGHAVPSKSDFTKKDQVVLLIHGFTASAEDLRQLADLFQSAGYTVINCTYPCFNGIDRAAEIINARLVQFEDVIKENRVTIVAHSMGGLVARALVGLFGGHGFVRGVITLGTPHLGTLKDRKALSFMLGLMESFGKTPFSGPYFPDSLSGKQLIGADKGNLLESLRNSPNSNQGKVTWVSFSGGKRNLEFGSNWFKNKLANWYIQKSFKDMDNDGLVGEDSASTQAPELSSCLLSPHHIGKSCPAFKEFSDINHTALVNHEWTQLEVLRHIKVIFQKP